MAQLFEILSTLPRRDFAAAETVIAEDSATGMPFFLIDGEVEVSKGEVPLASTSEPGSVFGEMSALPGTSHRASVRAVEPSSCYVVEDGRQTFSLSSRLVVGVRMMYSDPLADDSGCSLSEKLFELSTRNPPIPPRTQGDPGP
jgi:Cyclic nucleotide-binding domain